MDEAEQAETNENRFRMVNERISDLAESEGSPIEVLCECDDISCTEKLALSSAEYEDVRAYGDRFLVAPGHQSSFEIVIHERPGYLVVKKIGKAGSEAARDDPRRET